MEIGDLARVKSTMVCLKFNKSNYSDNWVSDYKQSFVLKAKSYVLVLDKTSSTSLILYKSFITIIPSTNLAVVKKK